MIVDLASSSRTETLAADLGVPLLAPEDVPIDAWVLVNSHDCLELRSGGFDGPVRVEAALEKRYRVRRDDPLGRAIGQGNRRVVDATAGLGTDTLMLIAMGFEVVAIEQSPIVVALLTDRLSRSGRAAAATPVTTGDATEILGQIAPAPDVVYLDPMFPGRRRSSALPRKELVALAEITRPLPGEDREQIEINLLETALSVATNRVVVKRLPESPSISKDPSHQLKSKSVRYDVYLVGNG